MNNKWTLIPWILLVIVCAYLLLCACASTNYYSSQGLASAQYETRGYVVITNWYGMVIFSGDCAFYWDQGDLVIGGKRYSGEKYQFQFGL